MTREDLINAMPIIKAFIDGKKLQYKDLNHEWEDLEVNDIDLDDFVKSAWRIKPESTYRPFKDAEECWKEMEKHHPFGWVTFDCDTKRRNISSLLFRDTLGNKWIELSNREWFSPHNMFKTMKFIDGSPFGVKVEE